MTDTNNDASAMFFLGAGASRAFGYPTTIEFLDLLKRKVHGPENDMLQFLTFTPGIADIEQVLSILDQVLENDNPLVKYLKHNQIKVPIIGRPAVSWSEFTDIAEVLRRQVREELFKTYGFEMEKGDPIKRRFETIFGRVHSGNQTRIHVFTTNYDSIIEKSLVHSDSFEVVDGFRERQHDTAIWEPAIFDTIQSKNIRINLYKVHGSLSWRTDRSGNIVRVNTEEKITDSKQFLDNILLYPASKIAPVKEPYLTLHSHLVKKMLTVHDCVVIGFSFRDPYLNAVFVNYLQRDSTNHLHIFSPKDEECLQHLFEAKDIPDRFRQQINSRAVGFEAPDIEGVLYSIMTRD
jgi:hypothetical protein